MMPRHRSTIVAACLVVAAVAAMLTEGCGPGPTPAAQREQTLHENKIEMWVAAQGFVKRSLRAPSTASFGSVFGEYQDPDSCVTDLGGRRYRVRGWVDAENAFGAKVRSDFVCVVKDEGETWRLESIEIEGR